MNTETKRHIDAARQVLVGVVPNPTSQIDQITNALIYKFMDDMDQSAIKQGGEPSFFVGDLKDYAWTRLMDTRIGNQERMNIYSEALVKFSESKQLPQLFREIFKSAFLPYRSPEVLGLFLKEISYFDYSHPEELGNAYEYLLSIMSSQGDAGQFRTPRHIIDFMVAVVNPGVDDKVLDPACGTGGFLVSAYNHIMSQHDGKNPDGTKNNEKPLTPDQRKTLMGNFEGYDVDPGMVRIAQVNMYLHQFKNPKIVQYDTLSMEERWGDKFSVILANPPFMSPKGGVSTHSKFSIQSTRSEVLFVDYIMNHLRPQGRAGIIVPEGVIFQSGKSHTQLRKNLVEDGLSAVVSLPSGVFNPYAGVKTSILLFDNEVAKKSKEILFVKIEDDGFDLGAQRRPVDKNDLPEALEILNKWKRGEKVESKLILRVEKTKIAENGDYNLSGERYKIAKEVQSEFDLVELGEILELSGKEKVKENKYPIMSITMHNGLIDQSDKFKKRIASDSIENYKIVFRDELVVGFPIDEGVLGFQKKYKAAAVSPAYDIWKLKNQHKVNIDYLEKVFRSDFLKEIYKATMQGAVSRRRSVPKNIFLKIKIPLPSLEIQEQIVAELDGYQNIITGAKQITTSWKPVIDIDPEWEKVKLEDVFAEIKNGKNVDQFDEVGKYRVSRIQTIALGIVDLNKTKYTNDEVKEGDFLKEGDILFSHINSIDHLAKTAIFENTEEKVVHGSNLIRLRPDFNKVIPKFALYQMKQEAFIENARRFAQKAVNQASINTTAIRSFQISIPSLEIQKQIVERIEFERTLVEASKKLIDIYTQKTKDTLAKLWSE